MTEHDIAQYLRAHPEFFEREADLLSSVRLISPHSQRAVSLQERQAEMLREKIRMLEGRLIDMIRHGSDNLALSDRMLCWARDLFTEQDAMALPQTIASSIQSTFSVPQVAIRVWGVAPDFAHADFARGVSEDARLLADSLREPFCGVNSGFEATGWLEHPAQAVSLALLPLRVRDEGGHAPAFGMLLLASPDSQRFTSTMGTEFLARIAEVASAALTPLR